MKTEASDLATLLWKLSTTATTHPNRTHVYHWARFLDMLSGTQPRSGDYQLARMQAATTIRHEIEGIRRSSRG